MKTTVEISDTLLARAKKYARKTGKPFRAVVEEGLRRVLDAAPPSAGYELPDRSVGDVRGPNPLETRTWPELRDEIYAGR